MSSLLLPQELSASIALEIIEMHGFFVSWFRGSCAHIEELFHKNMSSHFAPGFQIVFPNGQLLPGEQLYNSMLRGYGNNPTFCIDIRKVEVHGLAEGLFLATYEEWQKNALNSTPANNGRISSAIFQADPKQPRGVIWRHVHETWLPDDIVDAEPFAF